MPQRALGSDFVRPCRPSGGIGIIEVCGSASSTSDRTRRACSWPTSARRAIEPVATARTYLGLGAEIADTGTLRRKTIAAAARVCGTYADRARELGVERAQVIVTAPGPPGRRVGGARRGAPGAHATARADPRARTTKDGSPTTARSPASPVTSPSTVGVVDVGGGSTEIVVGRPGRRADLAALRRSRLAPPHAARARERPADTARAGEGALGGPGGVRRPRTRHARTIALAAGGSARALAKLVGRTFDRDDADAAVAILSRRRSTKIARDVGHRPVTRRHRARGRAAPRRGVPRASSPADAGPRRPPRGRRARARRRAGRGRGVGSAPAHPLEPSRHDRQDSQRAA